MSTSRMLGRALHRKACWMSVCVITLIFMNISNHSQLSGWALLALVCDISYFDLLTTSGCFFVLSQFPLFQSPLQTTSGCVFGGYSDANWNSRFKRGKFAASQCGCLFTIVNPSQTPPTRYPIKQPAYAINNHPRCACMVIYTLYTIT